MVFCGVAGFMASQTPNTVTTATHIKMRLAFPATSEQVSTYILVTVHSK